MKKKLYFVLFFSIYILSWAGNNHSNDYYDIHKIKLDFPTSTVEQKLHADDVITINNPLQGYVIILTHCSEESLAKKMYYTMLQEAASQDFLGFFSNTGYTTFIDADQGIVYGFLVDGPDFISLRFHNLDIISSTLKIVDQKMESWKN